MAKIISTYSYSNGSGKTTVATNLAIQAACAGKRVAIVDADFQYSCIPFLFHLEDTQTQHTYTIDDYLRGRCSLLETASRASGDALPPEYCDLPVWLVLADKAWTKPVPMYRDDAVHLLSSIHLLQKELALDYLFIDHSAGLNDYTFHLLGKSDVTVVVVQPDKKCLGGTQVALERLESAAAPEPLLIMNMVPPKHGRDFPRALLEQAYHRKLVGLLPLSEDLMELGSAGIFSLRYPQHALTREFRAMLAQILR